jgi:hypothetical protein
MSLSAGAKRRRLPPVARNPGAFDLNVRCDTRSLRGRKGKKDAVCPVTDDEVLNILPREILMAKKEQGNRYADPHMLHCFSAANGLQCGDASREQIMDGLVFAGISVTGYDLKHDKMRERQGFVSSLGGLNTIMNTGTSDIFPGDRLRVCLTAGKATRHTEGVHPGKKLFGVQSVSQSDAEFKAGMRDALTEGADRDELTAQMGSTLRGLYDLVQPLYDKVGGTDRGLLLDSLDMVVDICRHRRQMEIGKALSYAAPNHEMDIVLQ